MVSLWWEALFNLTQNGPPLGPLRVTVTADGRDLELEVDTGASVSIINECVYHDTWPDAVRPTLQMSYTVFTLTWHGAAHTVKTAPAKNLAKTALAASHTVMVSAQINP